MVTGNFSDKTWDPSVFFFHGISLAAEGHPWSSQSWDKIFSRFHPWFIQSTPFYLAFTLISPQTWSLASIFLPAPLGELRKCPVWQDSPPTRSESPCVVRSAGSELYCLNLLRPLVSWRAGRALWYSLPSTLALWSHCCSLLFVFLLLKRWARVLHVPVYASPWLDLAPWRQRFTFRRTSFSTEHSKKVCFWHPSLPPILCPHHAVKCCLLSAQFGDATVTTTSCFLLPISRNFGPLEMFLLGLLMTNSVFSNPGAKWGWERFCGVCLITILVGKLDETNHVSNPYPR